MQINEITHLPSSSSFNSDRDESFPVILVAVDTAVKFNPAGLQYCYSNLCKSNARVIFLGVLHRFYNPMGYWQRVHGAAFNGVNRKVLEDEIKRCMDYYQLVLQRFKVAFAKCEVIMEQKVAAGPVCRDVLVQAARVFRPHWIVLAREFKNDKTFYRQTLRCSVILMGSSANDAKILRLKSELGFVCRDDGSTELSMDNSTSHNSSTVSHSSTTIGDSKNIIDPSSEAPYQDCVSKKSHCNCCTIGTDSDPDADLGPTENLSVIYERNKSKEALDKDGGISMQTIHHQVVHPEVDLEPLTCSGSLLSKLKWKKSRHSEMSEIEQINSQNSSIWLAQL